MDDEIKVSAACEAYENTQKMWFKFYFTEQAKRYDKEYQERIREYVYAELFKNETREFNEWEREKYGNNLYN